MDGLILLERAKEAGLSVTANGDQLVIRGPKAAEPIVRDLVSHKEAVLAALPQHWACDTTRVIAQFQDPDLRHYLTGYVRDVCSTLRQRDSLTEADVGMQAFGLLLFHILELGIDVRTATSSGAPDGDSTPAADRAAGE